MSVDQEKQWADKLASGAEFVLKLDRASGAVQMIELTPSWWERGMQALRYVVTGKKAPEWFGPGTPLTAQAPPALEGRQNDYMTTTNLVGPPKVDGLPGVPFKTLRMLGDTCDVIRLLIERRKNQICKLPWSIVPRKKGAKPDQFCADLETFFMLPDKEHTWAGWLRMILEDHLVVDAATLYPRLARDGTLYALEPVDGTTIKRLIDDYGRTPSGDGPDGRPLPAYQQWLKGITAFTYGRDQLIYRPLNMRTNRLYGYSVVEQIVVTIQLALNRVAYQFQYYTDGSTPDLILKVPEGWNSDQIKEFKKQWDSWLAGELGARRGTMFVYNGTDVVNTKETILTDKFDEWLARICCFAFGESPQAFVQMMNRATAATAKETGQEDGIAPTLQWVKDLIDYSLAKYWPEGANYEFRWQIEEEVDAATQDKIDDARIKRGEVTINEVRARKGEDAIDGGDVPMIFTAGGAVPLAMCASGEQQRMQLQVAQAQASALSAKAGETVASNDGAPSPSPKAANSDEGGDGPSGDFEKRDASGADQLTKGAATVKLRAALEAMFKNLRDSIVNQLHLGKVRKAQGSDIDAILASLDMSEIANAGGALSAALSSEYGGAYGDALKQVGVATGSSLFDLEPARAADYAAKRAGELIGAGPTGGELADSTRYLIRGTITQALEEGWTTDELSKALSDEYAFSPDRADTIAMTEERTALHAGAIQGWRESGQVVGKTWLLSNDEGVCDICESNAEQGTIDLDEDFESGDDTAPAHPNCRCDVAPVISDDEEE